MFTTIWNIFIRDEGKKTKKPKQKWIDKNNTMLNNTVFFYILTSFEMFAMFQKNWYRFKIK